MLQMFHGPTSKTSPFCIGRKLKNNSVKSIIDNKLFSKLISVAFCSSISLNMTKKFQEVPKAVIAMTFYFVFCFLRLLYYLGSDIIFPTKFSAGVVQENDEAFFLHCSRGHEINLS